MTLLNQLVAIEKGLKSKTERRKTDVYHVIQKSPLWSGISRTYKPKDDDGDKLPSERTLVQKDAHTVIGEMNDALVRLFDVVLTKEVGNTEAKADVKVGTEVIASGVPVTYLLFLEKQLEDLATFVSKLPKLDPAMKWTYDDNTGVYATDVTETTRTKKVPRNHVLAEATDKHPAQVQLFHEDVVVGYWSTIQFSGALPADTVKKYADRVEQLREAVKFAREEANMHQIEDKHVGEKIVDFVFAD
ncbi:hypothetical protein PP304_gp198 [Gordonia phage Phendrix]|uniref:Uncharacterized protein n=2 Tax=Godonkavirus TaxID=2733178 RepID=A0A4D6E3Y2_9CAUD|nr:hypothetical protein HOV33_gp204 [Gordonia phage GodonK]YP_010649169.1 hypothetical protein PP304_gp198 [Gordonia phage Phendrix]QBZ72752.1 hypothetical protein SEA_GODONK_152 [Gordonia phage GodonK]QDK02672.1 hypothetical protein SEA_PHENDRIX_144 [Gordonia phage Phendrix]